MSYSNSNSPRDINRNRKASYNFMNDDIDNDIEIQLVPMENEHAFIMKNDSQLSIGNKPELENELESRLEQDKLYYLHQPTFFYDSLSNSPLSLSGNSSYQGSEPREEGDSIITDLEENHRKPRTKRITYKKLTFEEIEHSIQKNYKNEKLASQLDILITFVKGQKHLYTQSYHITQQKINALVFPSLLLSGSMMVIAPIIQHLSWSGYFLSGINALITIFTSVLNFWNLQTNLNQYNTGATHFDRLETSLIMTRNNVFLVDSVAEKNERILKKMVETETRMMEMKEENTIMIPLEIKLQAPIISHLDIFSFIHQMENQMRELMVSYKDVKNEIRYIMYKWKTRDYSELLPSTTEKTSFVFDKVEHETDVNFLAHTHTDNNTYYRSFMDMDTDRIDPSTRKEHERNRLQVLLNKKDATKQRILDQYKKYAMIDRVFSDEIQHAETVSYFFSWGFCWRNRERKVEPIVREFMANYGI